MADGGDRLALQDVLVTNCVGDGDLEADWEVGDEGGVDLEADD